MCLYSYFTTVIFVMQWSLSLSGRGITLMATWLLYMYVCVCVYERERKRKRGGCLVIKGRILQPARLKSPQCLNYTAPPGSYALNFSMTTWRAVLQNQLVSPLNYGTYTIYHLLTLKEHYVFPTQCINFHLFCEQTGINSLNCTAGLTFVMEVHSVCFSK